MEYVVDELNMDNSQGSSFKICFSDEVTLEQAVDLLAASLSNAPNSSQDFYVPEHRKYGSIDMKRGNLTVEDERIAAKWLRVDGDSYHIYRATENNMDFDQLAEIYCFLRGQ